MSRNTTRGAIFDDGIGLIIMDKDKFVFNQAGAKSYDDMFSPLAMEACEKCECTARLAFRQTCWATVTGLVMSSGFHTNFAILSYI